MSAMHDTDRAEPYFPPDAITDRAPPGCLEQLAAQCVCPRAPRLPADLADYSSHFDAREAVTR
jgi:hypothetical protein